MNWRRALGRACLLAQLAWFIRQSQEGGHVVKKSEEGLGETIKVILQALLIALVVRTLLFQPFNIPSGSLIPTLLIGDYLFVSKYSYGYSKFSMPFAPDLFSGRILSSDPKRGDIAVFKLPSDGSTDYIKRVIGLPGARSIDALSTSIPARTTCESRPKVVAPCDSSPPSSAHSRRSRANSRSATVWKKSRGTLTGAKGPAASSIVFATKWKIRSKRCLAKHGS